MIRKEETDKDMDRENSKPTQPQEKMEIDLNLVVENADLLDSWKDIAHYLNRTVRTVQRWEALQAMPVHRQLHVQAGSIRAFKSEINAWQQSRTYRKQFDGERFLHASSCVAKNALDENEQLVLRKWLEAILVQLTAQLMYPAGSLAPNSQLGRPQ